DAAERAQQQLSLALLDGAARDLDVLGDDGVADLRNRQAVRVQLLDVHDDVNFTGAAAGNGDLADAVDRLDGARDLLVGDFSQRPQTEAVGRDHDRHDRIGVRIDLGNDRRQQLGRHHLDRAGHFFTHVVDGLIEVPLEHEADGDVAAAFADAGGD